MRRWADAAATEAAGQSLGAVAEGGLVVCLAGDLGAGKTTFVRGFAAGLGAPGPVRSPTFALVSLVEGGRWPLWHADLYRLAGGVDLAQLGCDALIGDADCVVAIEWPERAAELPDNHLALHIREADGARDVEVRAHGPVAERVAARWA